MALVVLVFNFIQNHFVRFIVTAVIPECIKKIFIKIGEFLCDHFSIENGRKYATFSAYRALLFQER